MKGGRALLNLPGHHSTAAIVAEINTPSNSERYAYAHVTISDCSRTISLEFSPGDESQHVNDLHKVDVMIDVLRKFRRGLVAHQKKVAKLDS